ncbi:TRIAP1/MDM35 family protein ASCRUDRAFT_20885, partial [Ascoidea rubescens DSM 1968]
MGNVPSFASECVLKKDAYDACFNQWYDKFLKGESIENECQTLWYAYKLCVDAQLVKKNIIPA